MLVLISHEDDDICEGDERIVGFVEFVIQNLVANCFIVCSNRQYKLLLYHIKKLSAEKPMKTEYFNWRQLDNQIPQLAKSRRM